MTKTKQVSDKRIPNRLPTTTELQNLAKTGAQTRNGILTQVALPIYEHLYEFNAHAHGMAAHLTKLRAEGSIRKDLSAYCQILIEEARSIASQDVVESMNQTEIVIAARLSKRRTRLEKEFYG